MIRPIRPRPTARVIVPTHDRRALVLRHVAALRAQSLPPDRYEIVVVCDGCGDGTAEALRRDHGAGITVIEQEPSGPARARNRGAEGAEAPVLVFLDDDMRAEPDLLERHLETHRAHPASVVLGAMPVDDASPRSFLTEGLSRWAERRDAALRAPGARPGFEEVLTGNLSVSRAVFEVLGGFDEAFTSGELFGDEDLEFGWRAEREGAPIVYAPLAVASQVFDKTFRSIARDIRRGAAADARFARKHPEAVPRLILGRIDSVPHWERRALRFAMRNPAAGTAFAAMGVALLDGLARAGARGLRLEHLHAVLRAGLYGLGLSDAGFPLPPPDETIS